jgi:hypothetical protein
MGPGTGAGSAVMMRAKSPGSNSYKRIVGDQFFVRLDRLIHGSVTLLNSSKSHQCRGNLENINHFGFVLPKWHKSLRKTATAHGPV